MVRLSVAVLPLLLQVVSEGVVRFSHQLPVWLVSVSVAALWVTLVAVSVGPAWVVKVTVAMRVEQELSL